MNTTRFQNGHTHVEHRHRPPHRCAGVSTALIVLAVLSAAAMAADSVTTATETYDVVVYGATSAGVTAAVQVARMGRSVVLIEPSTHVGGMTSGGLGATDIGNKAAIGGLAREFYRRIKKHYDRDEAWIHETRDDYFSASRRNRGGEDAMWTFEPHVAEAVLMAMLREAHVPLVLGERLDLTNGVEKRGTRIVGIRMESGRKFAGRMFIDATYEGDLMALAGVSYILGREANETYGETLNGVQPRLNVHKHRFFFPVDPYNTPGDPASGLLPRIQPEGPGREGSGDRRIQAYCFRMCMTDVPANRRPWPRPDDYDPKQYELLLRYFEAGFNEVPLSVILMPNRKTDTNNSGAFSTDNIGRNYEYVEGDYSVRARIIREHETYQKGLMWTLAHHPRVPKHVRDYVNRWGLAADEFTDNDNWPHQLYIREARRMKSDYVMTEHNCLGTKTVADGVGLAAYGMDSHNVQRYVDENGHARNEGDVQVHGFAPYPISYRSIRPRKTECSNLLVPVCVSASHIAYGSIRMEPVFMVLGQSAATAACQAIEESAAVQDIDVARLQQRLLRDGQVLTWTGPRPKPPILPQTLPGIVLDDRDAVLEGRWDASTSVRPFVGVSYRHDGNTADGRSRAVFQHRFVKGGRYEIRIAWTPNPNRATNVPVVIAIDGKPHRRLLLNQRKPPTNGAFGSLGKLDVREGQSVTVTITNQETDGYVIIDAVQFLPADDPDTTRR